MTHADSRIAQRTADAAPYPEPPATRRHVGERGAAAARLVLLAALLGPPPLSSSLQAQVRQASLSAAATSGRAPCGTQHRERAVLLARSGEHAEAAVLLEQLTREAPDDLSCRGDLVAVLSWAGRHADALDVGSDLPIHQLDPIVAEAMGRSAREQGRARLAVQLYGGVVARDADRIDGQVGLTLSLLESGEIAAAEARVPALLSRFPEHSEAMLAAAHVFRAADRHIEALGQLRRILEVEPGHGEARRLEALTLADAGAASLAVERMREAPRHFSAGEAARLLGARAAQAVRWAGDEVTTGAGRPNVGQWALARVDSALSEVAGPESGFAWLQLRFDRVRALAVLHRMDEVLAEVEALEAEGTELPPFVQQQAADAALYLRRPDEAIRRYEAALAGWRDEPDLRIGLFHALIHKDRHQEARALLQELLDEEPELRYPNGAGEPLANPDRVQVAVALLLGRAFAGELSAAQRGLQDLHARAPLNLAIRQELATVHLWRGWPDRARTEYDRMLALAPDHVGARVGRAAALLSQDERGAARAAVDTLLALAPENEHVRRVAEDVRVDGLWELSVEAGSGRSSGGPALGTRDQSLRTRLVTPPIGDRVRLFVATRRSEATYDAGFGQHDQARAGVAFRSRPVHLEMEVGQNLVQPSSPVAFGASMDLRAGDRWSVSLRGDTDSDDVPLQATLRGLEGWRASAGLAYRASEQWRWSGEAALLRIGDGNRRWSAYSALERAFVRGPRSLLTGTAELYVARSSLADAPYFNPVGIVTPAVSVAWDWTLWRTLEYRMTQRTTVTAGTIHQSGFPRAGIFTLGYEHEWVLTRLFTLQYGVTWGRPVYDGLRERRTAGHVGLAWRLP